MGKRELGVLAIRGLNLAFIFDARQSLLWKTWTGAQPCTYLVQHTQQPNSYCSNLKLFLMNVGWLNFLHPRLEQYRLVFPKTILVSPFAFRMCVTSCS